MRFAHAAVWPPPSRTRRARVEKSHRPEWAEATVTTFTNPSYRSVTVAEISTAILAPGSTRRPGRASLTDRTAVLPIGKEVALVSKRLATLTCAALIAGAASGLSAAVASAAALQGAGSTLVAPIEAEWATAWANQTSNPTPTYQAVGSGTGLKDIGSGLVDFGASDAPISASTTPCPGCFQIPWALSATGISFNLPGIHSLHLTGGGARAASTSGQITNWNDSADRLAQPRRPPPQPDDHADPPGGRLGRLVRVHRLPLGGRARRSPAQVGPGTKPSFPVGPGATGNSGMVTAEEGTPGRSPTSRSRS